MYTKGKNIVPHTNFYTIFTRTHDEGDYIFCSYDIMCQTII